MGPFRLAKRNGCYRQRNVRHLQLAPDDSGCIFSDPMVCRSYCMGTVITDITRVDKTPNASSRGSKIHRIPMPSILSAAKARSWKFDKAFHRIKS